MTAFDREDVAARFAACPYLPDDPDELLTRADLRVEAGLRRVPTCSADERLIFDLARTLAAERARAQPAPRPATVPPELRTVAAAFDGYSIVADAVRRDLEAAGIPAPNLRRMAAHYRDEATSLRTQNGGTA